MHRIEVGKPLRPGLTRLPEAAQYSFDRGGHTLNLWMPAPNPKERKDIRKGAAHFAITVLFEIAPDVIFFLWRFGRADWSDASYSWHMLPQERRALPDSLSGNDIALLQVILADSDTAIVKGLRAVSLSPDFSRRLHDAIREQASRPWPGQGAYDAQIRAAYSRFQSARSLFGESIASTVGGK